MLLLCLLIALLFTAQSCGAGTVRISGQASAVCRLSMIPSFLATDTVEELVTLTEQQPNKITVLYPESNVP